MDTKEKKDSPTFADLRTIFIFLGLAGVACVVVFFRDPKQPEFRQVLAEVEVSESTSMDMDKVFSGPLTDVGSITPPKMVPIDDEDLGPVGDLVQSLEAQSSASKKVANKLEGRLEQMGDRLRKLEKDIARRAVQSGDYQLAKMTPCERTALEFIKLIGTYTPQTAKGRFEAAKTLVHADSHADFDQFVKNEMKTIQEDRRSLSLAIQKLPIRCSPAKTEKDKSRQRWVFKAIGSQSAAFGYEVAGKSDVAYLMVIGVGKDEIYKRNVPQVLEFSVLPAEMAKTSPK